MCRIGSMSPVVQVQHRFDVAVRVGPLGGGASDGGEPPAVEAEEHLAATAGGAARVRRGRRVAALAPDDVPRPLP